MTPPSNLVYPQAAINAGVEVPITPDAPTVTGTVTSFAVAPALPAGMTLNSSSGVIAGTPTSVAAEANYTVTASNAGGMTTAVLQIAVAITAPTNLVYPQSTINANTGVGIQPDTPSVTGLVTGYSVSPALPAGLSLNATTGRITGIPTAPAAEGTYVVTASNSVGSTTASLQITVSLVAPSNLVYAQTVINATTGTAIQTDVPNVTGLVSAFTVSPALPAGFSLNASTGVISGTPTTASAKANYTVTASNAAGSTTATLQITVAQSPPSNLVYPQTTINATVGIAIQADVPTVTGKVIGYGIVPDLPVGLSLDPSTGTISGTPTLVTAASTYVVSAENSGGTASTQLTITVSAPGTVLLDQGHQSGIDQIFSTTNDVLSSGEDGHWVLWNYSSGALIAEGDGADEIEMEGQIFGVLTVQQQLEIRSSQDGHLLFTIPAPFWFSLAKDGSYVCSGNGSAMTVWSTSGQPEIVKSGDYTAAIAFAATGQVQVAKGAAGHSVIETVAVPSGADTVSLAFSGNFQSWFEDGSKFITQLGSVVWVYSNGGVQQAVETLPTGVTNLSGWGNWIWSVNTVTSPAFSDVLQVYAVGSGTPTQSYTLPADSKYIASGNTIGALAFGSPQVSVIDLSGKSPSIANFALPPTSAYLSSYSANSSSQWIVGNEHGVLLDGGSLPNPRYLGYGAVYSISGGANAAAISTAIGEILLYNLSARQQSGSIDFLAGDVALSSDGTVLGAAAEALDAQYVTDRTLNLYSLPSMAVIHSFPYTISSGTPSLTDFSISGSGTVLGQVFVSENPGVSYSREVTGIDGNPLIWSDSGLNEPIELSPDGTLIAVSNGAPSPASVTEIYLNGTLVTAVPGDAEGWIDNDHLLVGTYASQLGGEQHFAGSTIYSPTGAVLSTLPSNTLPPISKPQFPTTSSVYDEETNAVYSLVTGLVTWQGPGQGGLPGTVVGPTAVYEFENRVVLTPVN